MKSFSETTMVEKPGENIFEYLCRIHSEFQAIHPFVDGNGRVGCLIMNLLQMRKGYPILTLPTSLSSMFNEGVKEAINGRSETFTRLLAEAIFDSLQVYEKALGKQLLPTLDDLKTLAKSEEQSFGKKQIKSVKYIKN